jgi:uncharacterized protein YjdB
VFDVAAVRVADFTSVRIVLTHPDTTDVVLDTTVEFPADSSAIRVPLSVPLEAGATSEEFDLTLAMINADGDTVFRGGPIRVTATVGTVGAVAPEVPLTYVGVGANAAGVRFVTAPATAFFGETVVFAAEAFDSAQQTIAGTPILYGVDPRDTAMAAVPDAGVGRVVAAAHRGSARVVARLLTGPTATATLAVQPRPAAIAVTGGNAQTATAGTALAQPVTVQVKAADSLGVAGVTVTFAVASGGGTVTASTATTDSSGHASVGWTLGAVAGTQTMTATVAGLTAATVTATATPAGPAILLSVPGSLVGVGASGLLLVKLSQGAPAGGVMVSVTSDSTRYLTVASPGAVAFAAGDTLQWIEVNGVAAGVSVVRATATGYAAGVTTVGVTPNLMVLQPPFSVGAGQSTSLSIQIVPAAPTGGLVVSLASTDPTVLAVTTPTVTITAGQTTGSATVQGVAAGLVGVTAMASGYGSGGTAVTVVGAAASLSLVSGGNQSAAVGSQLPSPVVVRVADSLGSGVSGRPVTFAVATGGGSVGTPSATTDAAGLASSTWTLGSTAGAQTLTVTATGLTGSPLTVTATARSGVASTTVTPQLDTLTALTATVTLAAQAYDTAGNPITGSFTWVSRAPSVASVSAGGVVTAVANGSAYVVATEAGGTKDSALIVVEQRLATIDVTPATRSIYLTGTFTFTATAVDGIGQPMGGVTSFTWTTTAPAVATVDSTGHVVGVGLGTAQIRATSGSVTGVANLSVLTPITRIAVVVDTVGAATTDTFTLTSLLVTRHYRAIAHDTLDAVMSGIQFAWQSTNPSVASVPNITSDTVTATSAANGVTGINASAQGFTSNPGASLTVSQVLASVELSAPASNPSATIGIGGTVGLVARGLDANQQYIAGGTFTYASATPAVATVDSVTGIVTGVATGTADITATSGGITSNALAVTVGGNVPLIISFGRDTVSVGRGSSASIPILLSTPTPTGGQLTVNLTATAFAHWNPASVVIGVGATSVNATLVGDSAGTTTVTATDGSGLGYATGTAVAKVTANMRLASSSYAINATDLVSTQVLLSDPSPAGGTYVTFGYGTAGIAAISPDPAFIPAGQLAADIQIRGLASGTTTITPTAIGVNGTASSFTAYAPVLTPSTTQLRLGQGQYEPNAYVQLPTYTNVALPVTLTSSDTAVVGVTPSVTVPANSYYAYFTTTAKAPGTATITLSATGWTAANAIGVVSTTPYVGVCCGTTLNTTSPQTTVTVYAEDSLRNWHYRTNSLVVRLSSSDPSVLRVIDTLVTINAGTGYNSAVRVVPGGLGGTAYVVATAGGHQPDSTLFTVVGPKLQFSWSQAYIGAGQYNPDPYISTPNSVTAPLVVSVANSNPTSVTVPAADTIPAGTYYRYFTVTGNATGSATFIATAPGYQSDTASFTVTSPALTVSGPTLLNNFGPGATVTVYTTDTLRTGHYRTTPLAVSAVSTDTTILKVDSSVVTVDSGAYYNSQARVTPVGVGTAQIIFTASGHVTLDTLTITVQTPKIQFSFTSAVVGRRQRFSPSGNGFYVYTPDNRTTPLAASITQLHGTVDSLTTTTPTIPATTYYTYLDAFGLAYGTDTLIVSAPGYLPDTAIVTVSTSKFTSSSLPSTTTTTNPPLAITIYTADSTGSTRYAMDTVVVAAVSSDTNVIRPVQPYFAIPRNAYYASTTVAVVGPGTASITYSDSAGTGYLPTTTNTVTVTGPALSLSNGSPMLGMRQTTGTSGAYVYTQNNVANDLVVNLASTDTRVVTVPPSVTIPAGSYYAYFAINAQDTIGTIQVQATATGYSAAATNVQVTQPKFVVSTATPLRTTSPATGMTVYAADANGTVHYTTEDVSVTLSSSAPSVAAIDSSTVTIVAGTYYSSAAAWSPGLVGTAQLAASDARAAYYRYNPDTVDVSVITPSLGFGWGSTTLGIGQYIDGNVSVPDYAVAPITVGLAHAGTARTSTLVGGVPVSSVTIPTGSYYATIRVAGASTGTDTLVETATSPPHNPDTVYTVVGPGRVDPIGSWPATLAVGDSVAVTLYARDPAQTTRYVLDSTTFTLAPSASLQFVSGGANSAVITSVVIPSDQYYVTFYVKGVTAESGSASISATNYQTYATPSVLVTP